MTEPIRAPSTSQRRLSRRRSPKSRVKAAGRLGRLDLGPNLALSVLDLSETGVRLVVKNALEPGREVSVSLEGQSHAHPVMCAGKVMWCLPLEDGRHCAGVAFENRLPYRDFVVLSQEPPAYA